MFKAIADNSPLAIYISTAFEMKAEYIQPDLCVKFLVIQSKKCRMHLLVGFWLSLMKKTEKRYK